MVEKRQNTWLPQNSAAIVLEQYHQKVSLQRKVSGVVSKSLLNVFIGLPSKQFGERTKNGCFLSNYLYCIHTDTIKPALFRPV